MLEELSLKAKNEDYDITQADLDNVKKKVGEQKKFGKAVNEIFPGIIYIGFISFYQV